MWFYKHILLAFCIIILKPKVREPDYFSPTNLFVAQWLSVQGKVVGWEGLKCEGSGTTGAEYYQGRLPPWGKKIINWTDIPTEFPSHSIGDCSLGSVVVSNTIYLEYLVTGQMSISPWSPLDLYFVYSQLHNFHLSFINIWKRTLPHNLTSKEIKSYYNDYLKYVTLIIYLIECVCVRAHVYIQLDCIYVCTHTHIYTQTYIMCITYIHMGVCVYTTIYMCIYIYICIHTNTTCIYIQLDW